MFNRLFELRYEVLTFLKNREKKPVYATNLESSRFLLRLAYLADIFSALNDLCISLQGQGTDVISSMEKNYNVQVETYLVVGASSKG